MNDAEFKNYSLGELNNISTLIHMYLYCLLSKTMVSAFTELQTFQIKKRYDAFKMSPQLQLYLLSSHVKFMNLDYTDKFSGEISHRASICPLQMVWKKNWI